MPGVRRTAVFVRLDSLEAVDYCGLMYRIVESGLSSAAADDALIARRLVRRTNYW